MPSPSPSPHAGRGPGRGADDVDLTDLEVIRRYSLAVRQDSADRSEVVALLRADLDRLERRRTTAAAARPTPQAATKATAGRSTPKRAPTQRTARG
ncbi:MAG TPA: hypothetical protein VIJ71_11000 [Mycobacteriales bacterium]